MFNVICLETNEVVESGFANGRDAAAKAKELTESTGKKHQPRPAKSDIPWQDRERARFADGTYVKLPWSQDGWFNRCPGRGYRGGSN